MTEQADKNIDNLIELTADVVSAYVSNQSGPGGGSPCPDRLSARSPEGHGRKPLGRRAGYPQACCADQEVGDTGLHFLP